MATEIADLSSLSEAPAPVETPTQEADLTPKAETETKVKDESAKVDETKPEVKKETKADLTPSKPEALAKSINSNLQKFFSEAKPTAEGKELLQKINKEVGSLYSQVAEAKAATKDVEAVTTSAKELSDLVSQSDALVYAGDPQIVENIYEDVLAVNGNTEAFDKLGLSFVDKIKETNPQKYYQDFVTPTYQHALEETGMIDAVRGLIQAYNAGDKALLRSGIEGIAKHIEEVGSKVDGHKAAAETKQSETAQSAYKESIQTSCDQEMTKALGAALRPILNTTELGMYPRETQLTVAREMRAELNRQLDADKLFQSRMARLYKAKDSEGIKKEYQRNVTSIAGAVTRKAIDTIYPNGLSSRAAAPAKEAPAKPMTFLDTKEGKALLLKSKPNGLLMDMKNAGILEIAGRGWVKNKEGKPVLVAWRKN
jgi:hypothetical protein